MRARGDTLPSHSHGDPWSRGRLLAPVLSHCPSSTHQGPGRVLGCPVAQLTLQLHVLCAPRHIPSKGNAVGLEGDGLDALQGWGVQLGYRKRRGDLEKFVVGPELQPHMWLLSMPRAAARVLQQEMGGTTPKHLGEWLVARDRSWCVHLLEME